MYYLPSNNHALSGEDNVKSLEYYVKSYAQYIITEKKNINVKKGTYAFNQKKIKQTVRKSNNLS